MSALKDRIIEAREAVGLDKAGLVRAVRPLQLTHSALSQLESGKSKSMKAETALSIAKVTGYRVEYLVFGSLPKRHGEKPARALHVVGEQGAPYLGPAAAGHAMDDTELLALVLEQADKLPLFSRLSPAQRAQLIVQAYQALAGDDRKPTAARVLRVLRSA